VSNVALQQPLHEPDTRSGDQAPDPPRRTEQADDGHEEPPEDPERQPGQAVVLGVAPEVSRGQHAERLRNVEQRSRPIDLPATKPVQIYFVTLTTFLPNSLHGNSCGLTPAKISSATIAVVSCANASGGKSTSGATQVVMPPRSSVVMCSSASPST
jgi:hypothetical protein